MRNVLAVAIMVIASCVLLSSCANKDQNEVVAYVSLDREYAEPILRDFQDRTGIKVRARYDTEATKTTGFMRKLLAERDQPQCDVFWNEEFARTIQLKNKGILQAYYSPTASDIPQRFKDQEGFWTGHAARARVLVYITKALTTDAVTAFTTPKVLAPFSIFDLTFLQWLDTALANPEFGTTSAHVAALWSAIGKDKTMRYFRGLRVHRIIKMEGNSVVRDRVASGFSPIGITDSDEVWIGKDLGQAIEMIIPDQNEDQIGTLIIPSTVALIKDCKHPDLAKQLIDYLLSREVEKNLAFGKGRLMPVRADIALPEGVMGLSDIKAMNVDYEEVAKILPQAVKTVKEILEW